MKKLQNREYRYFHFPVRIDNANLLQIVDLIRKTKADNHKLYIRTDDFEFENETEFAEYKGNNVSEISITTIDEGVNLHVNNNGVTISKYGDSTILDAVYEKVTCIIKKSKRRLFYFFRRPLYINLLSLVLILNAALLWVFDKYKQSGWANTITICLTPIAVFYLAASAYSKIKYRNTNIIEIIKVEKARSIFERNKDQIFVGIFTAIITAIISLPIGIIIGRLTK